jgi:predicted transcriptional regulator
VTEYSLTELQLEIMRVLWTRGEATVVEVQDALRPARDLAQATVATLLSRMERKGVIAHHIVGRQFVYHAVVQEQQARRTLVAELADVADRVFHGDVAALVSHLLAARDVAPADLARVRALIDAKEAEMRGRAEEA